MCSRTTWSAPSHSVSRFGLGLEMATNRTHRCGGNTCGNGCEPTGALQGAGIAFLQASSLAELRESKSVTRTARFRIPWSGESFAGKPAQRVIQSASQPVKEGMGKAPQRQGDSGNDVRNYQNVRAHPSRAFAAKDKAFWGGVRGKCRLTALRPVPGSRVTAIPAHTQGAGVPISARPSKATADGTGFNIRGALNLRYSTQRALENPL